MLIVDVCAMTICHGAILVLRPNYSTVLPDEILYNINLFPDIVQQLGLSNKTVCLSILTMISVVDITNKHKICRPYS